MACCGFNDKKYEFVNHITILPDGFNVETIEPIQWTVYSSDLKRKENKVMFLSTENYFRMTPKIKATQIKGPQIENC